MTRIRFEGSVVVNHTLSARALPQPSSLERNGMADASRRQGGVLAGSPCRPLLPAGVGARPSSALDAAHDDAAHEVALGGEEEDDARDGGDDRAGHQQVLLRLAAV